MSDDLSKKQKYQRVRELFGLAGQRYIEAGGAPHKSVSCNVYLNEEEQQELLSLLRSFSDKTIK